jgi:ketosteroid isomerase-like protein
MSRENVEIVRNVYEAWEPAWASGTEDLGELLALLDEALVTRRHAPWPDPGTWHGLQGFLDMSAEWTDTFDEFMMRGEEFIDAGDHVVVRVVGEGRGSGSGAPVTGTAWFVYGVRNGKLVTIDMYVTRDQALEAVGLSEQNARADSS